MVDAGAGKVHAILTALKIILKMKCFNCERDVYLEKHHVVPRSLGGKKTILLCADCHGLAHGNKRLRSDNHSELVKKGINRRKEDGYKWGRPSNGFTAKVILRLTDSEKNEIALFAKSNGMSVSELIRSVLQENINHSSAATPSP